MAHDKNGLFFTGDTCQTIARGVGFRFEELTTMFWDLAERVAAAASLSRTPPPPPPPPARARRPTGELAPFQRGEGTAESLAADPSPTGPPPALSAHHTSSASPCRACPGASGHAAVTGLDEWLL